MQTKDRVHEPNFVQRALRGSIHRHAGRLALVLGVSVLVGGSIGGVAHALNNPDDMVPAGPDGWTGQCTQGVIGNAHACQTDNRTLTWYTEKGTYSSYILEESDINIVKPVVVDKFAGNTVLTEQRHLTSDVVFSGSAETDIIYQEGDVPGTDNGYTWCDDPVDGQLYACDQQYVRVEENHYTQGLTCHETGHAVGLLHGLSSSPNVPNDAPIMKCMMKPTLADENLGTNNQDNIDATY